MSFHFSKSSSHFPFLKKKIQNISNTYTNVCYLHLLKILILLPSYCSQIYNNRYFFLAMLIPFPSEYQCVALSSSWNYLLSVLFRDLFKYLINWGAIPFLRSFCISQLAFSFPCADFFPLQIFLPLVIMWLISSVMPHSGLTLVQQGEQIGALNLTSSYTK